MLFLLLEVICIIDNFKLGLPFYGSDEGQVGIEKPPLFKVGNDRKSLRTTAIQRPKEWGVIERCTVHKVGIRAHPNEKLLLKKQQSSLLGYFLTKTQSESLSVGVYIGYVANVSKYVGAKKHILT